MRTLKTYLATDRQSGQLVATIDRVTNVTAAQRAAEAMAGARRNAPEWTSARIRYQYSAFGTRTMSVITELFDAWLDHFLEGSRGSLPAGWQGWRAANALAAFESDPAATTSFLAEALRYATGSDTRTPESDEWLRHQWQAHLELYDAERARTAGCVQPAEAYDRIAACLRRGEVPSAELDDDREMADLEAEAA